MIVEVKGNAFTVGPRIVYNGVNVSGEWEDSFIGGEGSSVSLRISL